MDVVFDLGNVVLNWNVDEILQSLDNDEGEKNQLRSQLFEHPDWLDMDRGLRSESSVVTRVVERSGLRRDDVTRALSAAKQSLVPIPESVRLLQDVYAAGITMYCLSNMSVETFGFIEHQEFFGMFKGVVISGKERCAKPDTEIYRLLIDRYGLRPADTLFIDDSAPNVHAARDVQMRAYHFKRSERCYSRIRELLL